MDEVQVMAQVRLVRAIKVYSCSQGHDTYQDQWLFVFLLPMQLEILRDYFFLSFLLMMII